MADVVTAADRSRMMAGIGSSNTKPEIVLRRALHALGFRFRLHDRKLPGTPDIVLPRYRAVVFVHGCFWHGHDCHLFKWPSTRPDFWKSKISKNREIDDRATQKLVAAGWRQAVVWECAIKGRTRVPLDEIASSIGDWLRSTDDNLEIKGK